LIPLPLKNMNRIIFLWLLNLMVNLPVFSQMNLTLLSHWNNPNLPKVDGDQIWNDVMGWHDTIHNREYIIAGTTDSFYFFDITQPSQIKLCDVKPGRAKNAVNRDYNTYSHYVYCVSDRSSPVGSLEIFDLQYLPDSVHKVYDNDTFSVNSHTLFIDAASQRLYLCGNSHKPAGTRSTAILSIADPLNPVYLGEIPKQSGCNYTHEMYARNDTAYCSCGYDGLFMFDVRDAANPQLISTIAPPYPQNGYNHSSWLDSSGKFLLFTDENMGLGAKIYDISDIKNPSFISVFNSNQGALPHNAYWKGRFAYTSSYEDGVYIFDLNDPKSLRFKQPEVAGYYDTYPHNKTGEYNGFHGCWGVWPFLPSGNIIASDMSEGIFVLQPSTTLSIKEKENPIRYIQTYPNPFTQQFALSVHATHSDVAFVNIYDIQGKTLLSKRFIFEQGANHFYLNESAHLVSGVYILEVKTNQQHYQFKLIKQ
jgi:choice-of-anchor B domain-containing protein